MVKIIHFYGNASELIHTAGNLDGSLTRRSSSADIPEMANVPPNPAAADPRVRSRLNRQASEWLQKNDKQAKAKRFFAKKRRERDAQKALNPGLIAARKRALHLKT